jgi:hypothetical protein
MHKQKKTRREKTARIDAQEPLRFTCAIPEKRTREHTHASHQRPHTPSKNLTVIFTVLGENRSDFIPALLTRIPTRTRRFGSP